MRCHRSRGKVKERVDATDMEDPGTEIDACMFGFARPPLKDRLRILWESDSRHGETRRRRTLGIDWYNNAHPAKHRPVHDREARNVRRNAIPLAGRAPALSSIPQRQQPADAGEVADVGSAAGGTPTRSYATPVQVEWPPPTIHMPELASRRRRCVVLSNNRKIARGIEREYRGASHFHGLSVNGASPDGLVHRAQLIYLYLWAWPRILPCHHFHVLRQGFPSPTGRSVWV